MKTQTPVSFSKGFRFPAEIIGHCIWLYFRFSLSSRDVEEMMAERGVVLTYETIRQWCLKCGQMSANELKRRRLKTGDKWHLDEVYRHRSMARRTPSGEREIRTEISWISWCRAAAISTRESQFFRKLRVRLQYAPRVIITDKLASYAAAKREIMPRVEHLQHARVEQSSGTFASTDASNQAVQAQRFLSAFGPILDHFDQSGTVLPPGIIAPSSRIASWCGTRSLVGMLPPNGTRSSPILRFFLPLLSFLQKALQLLHQVDKTSFLAFAMQEQRKE